MNEDLKMMASPDKWPMWPMLPVRKSVKGGFPLCGLMLAVDNHLLTVFEVNMFSVKNLGDVIKDPKIKRATYNEYSEIVADGWYVD